MIDIPLLLAFLVAASILTVTPGVDTAMVLRAAAIDGQTAAAMAGAGIGLGCLAWAAAVSVGLGALLQASEMAYAIVKLAGAGYLLWLGGKLLWKPRESLALAEGSASMSGTTAFRRGLVTNLPNPKVGVFYITFLPQFVPTDTNIAAYSFFLACVHVMLSVIWFGLLIAATAPLGRWLRQPRAVRTLDRITGAVFVLFGLRLALQTDR